MGRFIESIVPGAIATFYPDEAHHFVYDRWREILGVIVAEALGARQATHDTLGCANATHPAVSSSSTA